MKRHIKDFNRFSLNEAVDRNKHLLKAVENENIEAVKFHLDKGADPNAVEYDGSTPIQNATYDGNAAIIKLLLDAGARVDARNDHGWTTLHYAAAGNNNDMIRLLIDMGADIDATDADGWTPLTRAVRNGCRDAGKLLISLGGDPFTAFNSTEDLIKYFDGDLSLLPLQAMPEGPIKDKIRRIQQEEDLFGSDF